ncbi:MAG: DNA alkylation repair protein [Streptococcaceae bacterium]|jgi:3-methyladenine DNA glycosylase AlkD|nr:DNA alkylation repair protein [Streptococcaceae bacterium]
MKIDDLERIFLQHEDADQAQKMSAYLLGRFPHFGIQAPLRRKLTKDFISGEAAKQQIDWDVIDALWDKPEREFHQLVCDILIKMKRDLRAEDFPKIKELAVSNSWWDSVDALVKSFRHRASTELEIKEIMLAWSTDENFWIRRMAITSQLLAKEKTDRTLLTTCIVNNFESDEFFINKAIGWALRDYSKTNPDWVRDFLLEYELELNSLSKREAKKYL